MRVWVVLVLGLTQASHELAVAFHKMVGKVAITYTRISVNESELVM